MKLRIPEIRWDHKVFREKYISTQRIASDFSRAIIKIENGAVPSKPGKMITNLEFHFQPNFQLSMKVEGLSNLAPSILLWNLLVDLFTKMKEYIQEEKGRRDQKTGGLTK